MNFNPQQAMQAMQMMKGFNNPRQFVEQNMGQLVGNKYPMFANLITKAQNGQYDEVMSFAKNFCNETGIDFNKDYPAFMNFVNSNRQR